MNNKRGHSKQILAIRIVKEKKNKNDSEIHYKHEKKVTKIYSKQ